ncbi:MULTISPECIES: hypothetical protein [Cyanophyceae]|uniref:Uncharacterized protein n=1 Tax=Stenomitos frigidus AS-A4 TaxID=2933935 RepID=A0ABV0KSZ2_9CYAN|nr:hypothetical protein [Phormidium sp. FACHB-592]
MARKRRFADLIQAEMEEPSTNLQTYEDTEVESLEPTEPVSSELLEPADAEVPLDLPAKVPAPKTQSIELTESDSSILPKYQTLDRKETRLRADQLEALNTVTKGLNRKRRGKGERLTDNTLIRVAVDLLLSRADELQGMTEEELRQSLGLTE